MLSEDGQEIIGEDGTLCQVKLDIKYTPHASREHASLARSLCVAVRYSMLQCVENIVALHPDLSGLGPS